MVKDFDPDDHVIHEYYNKLCAEAPSWFRLSLRIEPEDFGAFFIWCKKNVARIFDNGTAVIFACRSHHSLSLDLHPCILPRRQPLPQLITSLQDLLSYILAMGYRRLCIPITDHRGPTMRKILTLLGFNKEGIIHGWVQDAPDVNGDSVLLDTEFWSIVR